jgi:cyclopropane fatty-acyl-phospholipid synthase-like methyltransferase
MRANWKNCLEKYTKIGNKMLSLAKRFIQMVRVYYSPQHAKRVSEAFWSSTTRTHFKMDEKNFDRFFMMVREVVQPQKDEKILDYGGGGGEISHRFVRAGFDVDHCDTSLKMVEKAQEVFQLDSCLCKDLRRRKYQKIFMNNAFFYVHPQHIDAFLKTIFDLLEDNGTFFITDTPDYDKRDKIGWPRIFVFLTALIPVYQIEMAGFFVKEGVLKAKAQRIGFALRSIHASGYRTHWVLSKIQHD